MVVPADMGGWIALLERGQRVITATTSWSYRDASSELHAA